MTDAPTDDAVAILGGTGPQGRGLALRLARAGVHVTIGSRDATRARETAEALAAGTDLPVDGAPNAEAATRADVVLVAVPWDAHEPTLRSLAGELAGRVVIDIVNPLTFDKFGPVAVPVPEGSAAEQARALLPRSTVVAGFHHVSAKVLLDGDEEAIDTDILVCGDDQDAKRRALALADRVPGARGVDAGPLRLARYLEDMTVVMLSVNRRYRTNTGLRLTNLVV